MLRDEASIARCLLRRHDKQDASFIGVTKQYQFSILNNRVCCKSNVTRFVMLSDEASIARCLLRRHDKARGLLYRRDKTTYGFHS